MYIAIKYYITKILKVILHRMRNNRLDRADYCTNIGHNIEQQKSKYCINIAQ